MSTILSVTLLVLAALLLLLPYLPPALAGWLVVIGYGALAIILLNLLAALLRRHWWRWAHLATVVLSLPLLWVYVPIISHSSHEDEQALRILSWNVDNFLVSRDTMQRSAQHILTLQPDIICLQERPHEVKVSWNDILSALPQHRHAVRNSHEDEVLNLAILSRHPITATGERTFKGSYNKYLWADVATDTDTLRIYSVHLQTTGITRGSKVTSRVGFIHNAVERDEQTLQLCHDIQSSPHPVIVCGDFNDTPGGYPARRLRMQLTDFSRRLPLCGTFKRWGDILKIDYMMCSNTLRPLDYQLIDTPWSDHKMQVGMVGEPDNQ